MTKYFIPQSIDFIHSIFCGAIMKKNVVVNGELKDLVTYCTAVYEVSQDIPEDVFSNIFIQGPIFEDKNFDIKVLGTLQKTTVARKSKIFLNGPTVTLQMRYEISKVTDIELSELDEEWISKDINRILEHFELLLTPYDR